MEGQKFRRLGPLADAKTNGGYDHQTGLLERFGFRVEGPITAEAGFLFILSHDLELGG